MKVNEIRDLSDAELTNKLSDLKAELFNLRFQHATKQLDNPQKIPQVKKTIARIQTIMKEREMQAAE
jgi:large subunit ribosomal protein L29